MSHYPRPLHAHLLSVSIAAALGCTALSASAQALAPVIADGSAETAASGAYDNADDGAAGYVFHALNNGSITHTGSLTLTATGINSAAVRAESGGQVLLNDSTVGTTGNGSAGLWATDGATITLGSSGGSGVTVSTEGSSARGALIDRAELVATNAIFQTRGAVSNGIQASNGATVTLTGGRVSTEGQQSDGVVIDNAAATLTGTRVETSGSSSNAVVARAGGTINADGVSLVTAGYGGYGAFADSGSNITLRNSTIESTDSRHGRGAGGSGTVTLLDTTVHALGASSTGVTMDDGGRLNVERGSITADTGVFLWDNTTATLTDTKVNGGGYGININGTGNVVTLIDVDISTATNVGTGIWLPGASSLIMHGGSISTLSNQGVAIDSRSGAVELEGVAIATAGTSAHGLYASKDAGTGLPIFEASGVTVTTTGAGSIGAVARLGGSVNLRDSVIDTHGAKGYGVLSGGNGVMTLTETDVRTRGNDAWAAVVNANGSLDINGGSLISEGHGALWVRTARNVSARNGARLIGGNGMLMAVDAAFASPFELSLDGDVFADGDIVTTPEDIAAGVPVVSDVRVRLDNRSHWLGASSLVKQVSLQNASRWTITGDSSVDKLTLDNSTLALSAPGASRFHLLTVNGDFEADNGLLIFNGALAGDDSFIDRLHVRGDSRGNATVQVNNVHGLGAQTDNGILLIQVDGTSGAAYTLNGRAVAGSYDYFLHKGGTLTPGDGHWYLRSELGTLPPDPCDTDPNGPACTPPPDPCSANPNAPGCITPPDPCLENPNGSGCVAPPDPCEAGHDENCDRPTPQVVRPEAGAYLANLRAAQDMFRMGYHYRLDGQNSGRSWVRVDGARDGYKDGANQLSINGNRQALTLGTDLLRTENGSSIGITLASGDASSTSVSALTGYYARGKVKGEALGVYGTWRAGSAVDPYAGFYVDGSVQRAQFRNRVEGVGLAAEHYRSRAWQGALETGYAVRVGGADSGGIFVEPQLQLGYSRWDQARHVEANGTSVIADDASGLFGRTGVRVSGTTRGTGGSAQVQPFLAAHWLYAHAAPGVHMDGKRVEARIPRARGEFSGGASLRFANGVRAWGSLGVQQAGGYHQVQMQLGMSYSW